MKKAILAALTTFALSVAAGPLAGPLSAAPQDNPGAQSSSAQQEGQVASRLQDTHAYKQYLQNEDIRTEERNGVLTLTGTVSDDSKKALAEETASALPGVKKVENKLEVKKDQPHKYSDAWITAKAKTALLLHKGVSSTDTEIGTKDGVVTLRGQAETDAQKELTTEYVRDLDGVKEVRNEMTVSGPVMGKRGPQDGTTDNLVGSGYPPVGTGSVNAQDEKIDDASITASVKSALAMNRSGAALSEVRTEDGVVTIRGEAKSAEEKDRVSRQVSNIRGVRSVRNEMSIASSGSGESRPDRTLTGQEGVSAYPARPTGSTPQGDTQQK